MSAITEPGPPVAGTKAAAVPPRLADELYRKSGAERWKLPAERFTEVLERSIAHMFRASKPPAAEVESYLRTLHVEDLALACACMEGSERAWEHFVREFRPVLYAAGRAISRGGQGGESNARELADSIYADLYGLPSGKEEEGKAPAGRRGGLFRYFHGRSKLSTWLRAVLAQRHVDALRASRRTESLDEEREASGSKPSAVLRDDAGAAPPDPERVRYTALLQATLTAALAALDPRDRLRLCYYYVQDLTLAQIGRLLGEHEATVSRKLDRTRSELRKQVERRLRDTSGLSDAQVQLCFEYARGKWPFDLTDALGGASSTGQTAAHVEKQ
jgi:RNA polymerase sigma factor (sigma-70 family)